MKHTLDVVNKQFSSVYLDFLELILLPNKSKLWLQKVANLLKELLQAEVIVLKTFFDNLTIISLDNLSLRTKDVLYELDSVLNNTSTCDSLYNKGQIIHKEYYIYPLSLVGTLMVKWKSNLDNEQKHDQSVFKLLTIALENRIKDINQNKYYLLNGYFSEVLNIMSGNLDFKTQISYLVNLIGDSLCVSRCQVKFFSNEGNISFDPFMHAEYLSSNVVEAKSVINEDEHDWLKNLGGAKDLILNKSKNKFNSCVDELLSIQSVLGVSIVYKEKVVGVLVLHQCDYQRIWRSEEISYVKAIASVLGSVYGREIAFEKLSNQSKLDQTTGLIVPDLFLKELNHVLIESKINNIPVSLIMIDIEKLSDINLKYGYLAGNLVLSQTARILKRIYADAGKIARYSNDEFIIMLQRVDQNHAKEEAKKLKEALSNVSVLGVGTVEYNFSFVTFPSHSSSVSELLSLLEQAMILSKSRGKFQISSFEEIKNLPRKSWHKLISNAIPEIILRKSNIKTGPEMVQTISKQITELSERKVYSADLLDAVQSLAIALDAKDSYTEGHSKRVSEYAYMLAREAGLDLQEIEWVRLAAILHDIGKIGIPEYILLKPSQLTKEEFEVIKKHPIIGAKILKPIKPLERVAFLILNHHEYWDGSGYPNGLSGENIPVGSRIVSIVDAYQAMISDRPYRASLSFSETINRLENGKGKQWDPCLIDIFIKMVS